MGSVDLLLGPGIDTLKKLRKVFWIRETCMIEHNGKNYKNFVKILNK